MIDVTRARKAGAIVQAFGAGVETGPPAPTSRNTVWPGSEPRREERSDQSASPRTAAGC
jgi:hypothetical protein